MMKKCVYNNTKLMKNIGSIKRYIDDGAGTWFGTKEEFHQWITKINEFLKKCGLHIDEYFFAPPNSFVPFLDIQFCFTPLGKLEIDLYIKPTDSRSYLNFHSAHPNHVFSGIVFPAFLRLRRIINCNTRLEKRIEDLKVCFKSSGYPNSMIDCIATKVRGMKRIIERKKDLPTSNEKENLMKIRVISTFGNDTDLIKTCEKFEYALSKTQSFNGPPKTLQAAAVVAAHTINHCPTSQNTPKLFSYVKKIGGNLSSKLVRTKELALGKHFGKTKQCKHRNCKSCEMIASEDKYSFNGITVRTAEGTCTSYNIIYLVVCNICNHPYIGRSSRQLNSRIGEHRRNFYQIIDKKVEPKINNETDKCDDFALGAHLYNHGLRDKHDFTKFFKVSILEVCSPKILEVKEHLFIHTLNTLSPFGINLSNPFSIPVLFK